MTAPAPPPTYPTQPCRSCNAPCIWTTNAAGRTHLVDPQRGVAGGSIALTMGTAGVIRSRVIPAHLGFGRKDLYRSHFATCPNANEHRSKPPRKATR